MHRSTSVIVLGHVTATFLLLAGFLGLHGLGVVVEGLVLTVVA